MAHLLTFLPPLLMLGLAPRTPPAQPAVFPAYRAEQPQHHVVDRENSVIGFVANSRFDRADGTFHQWQATLQLDPDNWSNSGVMITIDAASIDTDNEKRDRHLRSEDFFDAVRHPTVQFRSVAVEQRSPTTGVIRGDLTIRGVTHRIAVPVSVVFYEEQTGRFRGEFTLSRKAFGVSHNSLLNPIDDDVLVRWDFTVRRAVLR